MAGSQSLVCITDTFTFTTSATTTTATPGLVLATVIVPLFLFRKFFLFKTAKNPCSGQKSLGSTPPPPHKTPEFMSKESYGTGDKNKGGARGVKSLLLLLWALPSPIMIQILYFTPGLVDDIVQHTNTFAYIKVARENSTKRCYMESDGSW